MRYPYRTLILAAAVLLLPGGLLAQASGTPDPPRQLFGMIFAGLSIPTRDLGTIRVGEAATQVQFTNKMSTGPSGGLGLAMPLRDDRATLRVSVAYTPLNARNLPALCDGDYNCSQFDEGEATATVFAGTAAVTFQGGDVTRALRPYFLVGASLRAYRFDDGACSAEALTCEALTAFLSDQVRPSLKVGLGTFLGTGRVRAMAEVHALFGTFQATAASARGETQNDLVLSVGLLVPLATR